MHHAKNCGNKIFPYRAVARILAFNALPEYIVLGGATCDCARILDSIAKKNFHNFSPGASLHHHLFILHLFHAFCFT